MQCNRSKPAPVAGIQLKPPAEHTTRLLPSSFPLCQVCYLGLLKLLNSSDFRDLAFSLNALLADLTSTATKPGNFLGRAATLASPMHLSADVPRTLTMSLRLEGIRTIPLSTESSPAPKTQIQIFLTYTMLRGLCKDRPQLNSTQI